MRLALALVAASATIVSPAWADVVLVHPQGADAFIEEIFQRVAGELRVHAISAVQEESPLAEATPPLATGLLARTRADACIFVSWRGDTSVVRIWVAEGGTHPPSLLEAVALQRTSDVPTMLAARAVDLLTGALKSGTDVLQGGGGPSPVATAHTPERPAAMVAMKGPLGPWSVEGGLGAFGLLSRVSTAWGPEIRLSRAISPRFGCAMWLAGPLLGDASANAEASAQIVQGVGLFEVDAVIANVGPLRVNVVGGLGAYFIDARGTVADGIASLEARRDRQWMAAGAGGFSGTLHVSSRVSFVLSARAVLLLPQARVEVGRQDLDIAEPWITAGLTLRFAF